MAQKRHHFEYILYPSCIQAKTLVLFSSFVLADLHTQISGAQGGQLQWDE
jgi:hypothetical protein